MEIREKVKIIRTAKGWSQRKLAEKAGINTNTVLNFETGHNSPSIDIVLYMLNAMGYTIEIVKNDERSR